MVITEHNIQTCDGRLTPNTDTRVGHPTFDLKVDLNLLLFKVDCETSYPNLF